ncbi:hypothetical protein HYV11_02905 [Candidatus Dependentiae bacterium]|nr:hypothetical protein [Candidatus Dependentiae bacterium]
MSKIILYTNMKKIIFIILVCFFKNSFGLSDQDFFFQGNEFFKEGKFTQAILAYQSILQKNSAVWYNLGSCHFNEGDKIKALVCWIRAEKNASLQQRWKLLNLEDIVIDQYQSFSKNRFIRIVRMSVECVPLLFIQILMLLLFIFIIKLFYRQVIVSKIFMIDYVFKKKILFIAMVISFLLILLKLQNQFLNEKKAIVVQPNTVVYVGPETSFPSKIIIPQGSLAFVIKEEADMIHITSSCVDGWVLRDMVEIV